MFANRIRAAGRIASIHLGASLGIAAVAALVVLGLWYPYPYSEISSGHSLFFLMMAVDVVCGPLLTLILFSPSKSKSKWRMDVALIAALQIGALVYGLVQVASARPIYLAFEGNRMRVVHANQIDAAALGAASAEFSKLGLSGPKLLGVQLAQPTDTDYLQSVQLSLQGLPPALRPERWLPYEQQKEVLRGVLLPIAELKTKNPEKLALIETAVSESSTPEPELGYLPLVSDSVTDWVVIFGKQDGLPKAYLHTDGW